MHSEYYVDKISSVSVEGPVVSLDFGRLVPDPLDNKKRNSDKKVSVTLTVQNFVQMVNMLNQTVKQMSDRAKNEQENNKTSPENELTKN
jgi:hypothetical protein